jgi:hypothetical protein
MKHLKIFLNYNYNNYSTANTVRIVLIIIM